jgi:hypothetical protein
VLPGQDIIVAHNLASDPVATCRTAAQVVLPDCGPTVPHVIEMPLSIRVNGSANNILTVTLVGQRRQT